MSKVQRADLTCDVTSIRLRWFDAWPISNEYSNFAPVTWHAFYKITALTKMTIFPLEGVSKIFFVVYVCSMYVHMICIWNFKPKISPIFHFQLVNDGWFSPILHVNDVNQHRFYYRTNGIVQGLISIQYKCNNFLWVSMLIKILT
jgi:hypothetical protein